jgi:agmatinase
MCGRYAREKQQVIDEEYHVIYNFGAIPPECISYDTARVVILPVPLESTTTYRAGTRSAPEAIIRASGHMELYDEVLGVSTYSVGIHTLPELTPPSHPEKAARLVKEAVGRVLRDGKVPCVMGGEHSVTVGSVQAVYEQHTDLSVLYLDAHADLRDEFAGSSFSHACVARRVSEICPVVQVGLRSLSEGEVPLTNSGNVTTFFARELRGGLDVAAIVEKLNPNVYITIDMDVFDPSVVPGVGTPEPGGLDWLQVNEILRAACENRTVCGFDLVELCSIPGSVVSEYTAARLIYRLIGLIARSRGWFD